MTEETTATKLSETNGGRGRLADDRPMHVYKLPEQMVKRFGVKEVGLVELTAEEEMMATRRTRNDAVGLAFELSKESLRMIDGKLLSTGDGTADRAWNVIHPQIRQLVVQAYGELHTPNVGEADDFLKSHEVRVG